MKNNITIEDAHEKERIKRMEPFWNTSVIYKGTLATIESYGKSECASTGACIMPISRHAALLYLAQ